MDVKNQIISILSNSIKKELVIDLVNTYEDVKNEFILRNYVEAQSKSGKFVENVFRVLAFIGSNQVKKEIKPYEFEKITEKAKKLDGEKYPESIRILIPNIIKHMIYEPRSKLGSVHVKPINPDFIDAKLTIGACDWVMAEFLRLYHVRDVNEVMKLIRNVVKDHVPLIQVNDNQIFITAKVSCEDEILIRLSESQNGMSRLELGASMKAHFSPSTITHYIKELSKSRDIFLTEDEMYIISDFARKRIGEKILEMSGKV